MFKPQVSKWDEQGFSQSSKAMTNTHEYFSLLHNK